MKIAHKVVLIVWIIYALCYIYCTSFPFGKARIFCLHDDQMVSMTYARNLADGHGFRWQKDGEKVEAPTNLGWVMYMVLWHKLGIPLTITSLFIQLSALLFMLLTLVYVRKVSEILYPEKIISLASVILTGFYLPFITWGLQGFEISILALLLIVCVWWIVGRKC